MAKATLIFIGILGLMLLLMIPAFNFMLFGKFTFSTEKAFEYDVQRKSEELNCNGWRMTRWNNGYYECDEPICKRYNIAGKKCVEEGYTGKGFFGMTDWDTRYYVCEGYGRIALNCEEHYTREEFDKENQRRLNEVTA